MKQVVSCCPIMDAVSRSLIWHQGPCMAPRSQESAASAGGYALPISWSSNSAKSIQIWLQPDLCRLQGLRLWKKSRHIQVFKIVNNFDCKQLRWKSFSDLCLNRNFMVVRLSDFFSIDLAVPCHFWILLPCRISLSNFQRPRWEQPWQKRRLRTQMCPTNHSLQFLLNTQHI